MSADTRTHTCLHAAHRPACAAWPLPRLPAQPWLCGTRSSKIQAFFPLPAPSSCSETPISPGSTLATLSHKEPQ